MNKLQTKIASQTDATLTGALNLLVAKMENGGKLINEERMVHAALCDELEKRHNLTPVLDEWLEQDEAPELYGRVILNNVK